MARHWQNTARHRIGMRHNRIRRRWFIASDRRHLHVSHETNPRRYHQDDDPNQKSVGWHQEYLRERTALMPKGIPKNGVNKGWFKKGSIPQRKSYPKGKDHPMWKCGM